MKIISNEVDFDILIRDLMFSKSFFIDIPVTKNNSSVNYKDQVTDFLYFKPTAIIGDWGTGKTFKILDKTFNYKDDQKDHSETKVNWFEKNNLFKLVWDLVGRITFLMLLPIFYITYIFWRFINIRNPFTFKEFRYKLSSNKYKCNSYFKIGDVYNWSLNRKNYMKKCKIIYFSCISCNTLEDFKDQLSSCISNCNFLFKLKFFCSNMDITRKNKIIYGFLKIIFWIFIRFVGVFSNYVLIVDDIDRIYTNDKQNLMKEIISIIYKSTDNFNSESLRSICVYSNQNNELKAYSEKTLSQNEKDVFMSLEEMMKLFSFYVDFNRTYPFYSNITKSNNFFDNISEYYQLEKENISKYTNLYLTYFKDNANFRALETSIKSNLKLIKKINIFDKCPISINNYIKRYCNKNILSEEEKIIREFDEYHKLYLEKVSSKITKKKIKKYEDEYRCCDYFFETISKIHYDPRWGPEVTIRRVKKYILKALDILILMNKKISIKQHITSIDETSFIVLVTTIIRSKTINYSNNEYNISEELFENSKNESTLEETAINFAKKLYKLFKPNINIRDEEEFFTKNRKYPTLSSIAKKILNKILSEIDNW